MNCWACSYVFHVQQHNRPGQMVKLASSCVLNSGIDTWYEMNQKVSDNLASGFIGPSAGYPWVLDGVNEMMNSKLAPPQGLEFGLARNKKATTRRLEHASSTSSGTVSHPQTTSDRRKKKGGAGLGSATHLAFGAYPKCRVVLLKGLMVDLYEIRDA